MAESQKGKLGTRYSTFTVYDRETGAALVADDRTFNPEFHSRSPIEPGSEQKSGDSQPSLQDLTKEQLVQMGAELGLELDVRDRKDSLVAAIEAAQEE